MADTPKVELRRHPKMTGQAVEKPKNPKETLGKLLRYFVKSKNLLFALLVVLLAVTITSLATPALQLCIRDSPLRASSIRLCWFPGPASEAQRQLFLH